MASTTPEPAATTDKWAVPTTVSDVELAFPANALDLMPPLAACEEGLAALPRDERAKWLDFQSAWFMSGIPPTVEFDLRDGIDGNTAIRHLGVIQGSYAPKHEHKEAAVAYLASRWFADVRGYKKAQS